jgi:hypothetical protein
MMVGGRQATREEILEAAMKKANVDPELRPDLQLEPLVH